jgi:hypothetical protein
VIVKRELKVLILKGGSGIELRAETEGIKL